MAFDRPLHSPRKGAVPQVHALLQILFNFYVEISFSHVHRLYYLYGISVTTPLEMPISISERDSATILIGA